MTTTRIHSVEREMEVAYAHRLHSDTGKCRTLHGHNAKVTVAVRGTLVDGMVLPFAVIKAAMQEAVDSRFDHRMVLQVGDPWLYNLADVATLGNSGWKNLDNTMRQAVAERGWWDTSQVSHNPFKEMMDIVVIAEQPTSENFSYLIWCWLSAALAGYPNVDSLLVRFQETSKGAAVYSGRVTTRPLLPVIDG